MSKKHVAAASLVTGALVLAPAAGALALAPFPDGDRMYSAGYWEETSPDYGDDAFWSVTPGDPTTFTVIEADHDDPPSITDGAYDPSTGASYVIGHGYEPECELWNVDVDTGAYTFVATITQTELIDDGTPALTEWCGALEILDDGTAYITIFEDELFTLNLASGAAEYVGEVTAPSATVAVSVLSTDPETGITYAIDYGGNVFTIDLSNAAATPVTTLSGPRDAYDADFDSAGVWWLVDWPGLDDSRLLSISDMNDINGTLEMGEFVEGWGSDAIWIIPAQEDEPAPPIDEPEEEPEDELAATGTESAPLMLGASLLLLIGTIVVIRRARTARD